MPRSRFSSPATHWPRRLWAFAGLLVLLVLYIVAHLLHWDDRLRWSLQEWHETPAEQAQAVWLPGYRVDIDAKRLPGLEDDEASDLAYDPDSKTLYSVMGKHPFLVQLGLDGEVLRKIALNGWTNPEGVAVLEGGHIAITDERSQLLTIVTAPAGVTALNIADFPQFPLGDAEQKNKGTEAVAWDPRHHRVLFGQERPIKLASWNGDGSTLLAQPQPIQGRPFGLRNLSAMTVDPRTGHVLLLSADSHLLVELDDNAQPLSYIALLAHFHGLGATIPQAEGVALDEQGTLYMVSEPNLFYRFKKVPK
ncbi:SdiA-regulated domain-containing protein [Pseudomonas typographi]|uniref:SdiA-regulated domain-containing protein n=1 Tax=Pseudomonas typographi TaxID=2715964 RepID=A0ABR7YZ72_9PSED|nr:SdiA-regulated domain-containing protein [Pseudomonas typographi]MBD1585367.1 SdiA-regulated domain-containing protein [Pseudomonas typographi]MBD1598519.1 SdiA-regulated domain-containing protein [Pseudomonas typographi]